MAFEEYKNLWVFIETEEGKAKPVGYELLTPGRRLADANQEKLVAVVIGKNVEGAAKEAEEYGAGLLWKKTQNLAGAVALVAGFTAAALLIVTVVVLVHKRHVKKNLEQEDEG